MFTPHTFILRNTIHHPGGEVDAFGYGQCLGLGYAAYAFASGNWPGFELGPEHEYEH